MLREKERQGKRKAGRRKEEINNLREMRHGIDETRIGL